VTQNEIIAYFPEACNSELLHSCFEDIPQGEPELVQELLRPWLNRTMLFRLFNRLRRPSTSSTGAGTSDSGLKTIIN
jgi:hypothetical protein